MMNSFCGFKLLCINFKLLFKLKYKHIVLRHLKFQVRMSNHFVLINECKEEKNMKMSAENEIACIKNWTDMENFFISSLYVWNLK